MAGNPVPQIIAAENGPWSQLRTGTVVSFTANQAVVSVGGSTFTAAYLEGITLRVGGLVAVLRQDASWLILGNYAGVGVNLLAAANPSFEMGEGGEFPPLWFPHNIAGTAQVTTEAVSFAPDGAKVMRTVSPSGAASNSYLYSQPIPVQTGWQFSVSAFVGGDYAVTDTPTADAALVALWFANSTNLYPTTSSADTVIVSASDVIQAPPFTTLSGTVTAPVNGFMRVALRSTVSGTQALRWDGVIVRRI